jgi:hypothetical protein
VTDEEDQASAGPGDEPLADRAEVLFRQVHPSWVDDGVPSSQAFVPTRKDQGELSIARGSLTTAEAAHKHYTTVRELRSAGSWGVSVGEALDAGLNSFGRKLDDDPAHGFADFRGLRRREAEAKGKLLVARARERGRLYPAAPDGTAGLS